MGQYVNMLLLKVQYSYVCSPNCDNLGSKRVNNL